MPKNINVISPDGRGTAQSFAADRQPSKPFQRTARPMETHEQLQIEANLMRRGGVDADPAQIASAVVSIWQEIAASLNPIIGKGGVDALYQRSLYLTSTAHPWLMTAHSRTQPAAMGLDALRSALKGQSGANAAAGGAAMLHTFYALLSSLIGAALTRRVLHSIRINFLSEPPEQDTQP